MIRAHRKLLQVVNLRTLVSWHNIIVLFISKHFLYAGCQTWQFAVSFSLREFSGPHYIIIYSKYLFTHKFESREYKSINIEKHSKQYCSTYIWKSKVFMNRNGNLLDLEYKTYVHVFFGSCGLREVKRLNKIYPMWMSTKETQTKASNSEFKQFLFKLYGTIPNKYNR